VSDKRIDGRLADYEQAYLMCRYRRHLWDHVGFYRARHDGGRYIVSVLECASCTAQREDWLQPADGSLVHRYMRYPSGYTFSYTQAERDDALRVRSADVARVLVKRSTIYDTVDAFQKQASARRLSAAKKGGRATARIKLT
jgi:hypothetical protein